MTKLAYVGELQWRWVQKHYVDSITKEKYGKREKELGYWLDGEWKPIPTEGDK